MLEKCIIKKNDNYEVVNYESGKRPLNAVLDRPFLPSLFSKYELIESGVKFSWSGYGLFEVYFRNKTLFKSDSNNYQVVLDILNKYKNLSLEELQNEYESNQQVEKSALELEIEKLKEEKQKIINESKKYRDLVNKGAELLSLIKDLDTN